MMRGLPKRKKLGGDFLCLTRMESHTLRTILNIADRMKKRRRTEQFLQGKILAMIFDKPSTRTRVSFDVAMRQLGGSITALSGHEMQLGRGESIADTAKVLSRYVNIIMMRTDEEDRLLELAKFASVPVINGLTDASHPCQIMADVMTFEEHRGSIKGKKITWLGDGNNVSASLAHVARHFDFELHLAVPQSRAGFLTPAITWANQDKQHVFLHDNVQDAAQGAHAVVTDTWVSMGDEAESSMVKQLFMPYQVNQKIMSYANADAVFMHCLPAHRGEEVTAEVLDGPQSIVWDEAENRLHVQKSIILWCLGGRRALLLPGRFFQMKKAKGKKADADGIAAPEQVRRYIPLSKIQKPAQKITEPEPAQEKENSQKRITKLEEIIDMDAVKKRARGMSNKNRHQSYSRKRDIEPER